MKLSAQVCNLKQAKKLKQLGVTARTTFVIMEMPDSSIHDERTYVCNTDSGVHNDYDWFFAPNVAELGVAIALYDRQCGGHTEYNFVWKEWNCYAIDQNADVECQVNGKTEAEARAEMLILLLESGRISASEVNKSIDII